MKQQSPHRTDRGSGLELKAQKYSHCNSRSLTNMKGNTEEEGLSCQQPMWSLLGTRRQERALHPHPYLPWKCPQDG